MMLQCTHLKEVVISNLKQNPVVSIMTLSVHVPDGEGAELDI